MVSEGRWRNGERQRVMTDKILSSKGLVVPRSSHRCKTLCQNSVANWRSDKYWSGCYKGRFAITSQARQMIIGLGCDSYLKDNVIVQVVAQSAFEIFFYFSLE